MRLGELAFPELGLSSWKSLVLYKLKIGGRSIETKRGDSKLSLGHRVL